MLGKRRRTSGFAGRYDGWEGHYDLFRFVPAELDQDVTRFIRALPETPEAYAVARSELEQGDFDVLFSFARRMFVRSVLESDPGCLSDALSAVTLLDSDRYDFRDIYGVADLVSLGMSLGAVPSATRFRDAAELAAGGTAERLRGLADSPQVEPHRSLVDIVERPEGNVVIGWGIDPYAASHDLRPLAFELADVIESDSYRASSIDGAASLPGVWLRGVDANLRERLAAGLKACISIRAQLDPSEVKHAGEQMFVIWLGEARDEAAAAAIAEAASPLDGRPEGARILGLASGALVAVVVARSTYKGVASYENDDSLSRFGLPIQLALDRAAGELPE